MNPSMRDAVAKAIENAWDKHRKKADPNDFEDWSLRRSIAVPLADAAIAATEQCQWRPISEAPKDGQKILVGGGACPYVHINRFYKATFKLRGGIEHFYLEGLGDGQQPSHWMSIPQCPYQDPELAKEYPQ